VSSTINGTLYTHGIQRIRIKNGQYTEWEQLDQRLNIGRISGGNPFINPDESYILFNKKWPKRHNYGIFISYRTRDDNWTELINLLEKLNAPRGGSQPIVTPDGKYLFYYAGGKFYWIDAKIIETLKSDEFKKKEFNMKKVLPFLFVLFFCHISAFSQNDGEDVVIVKYHVINSKILG